MLDQLITQMAEREGITEELKSKDQMMWVQRMSSIQHQAKEIVHQDREFWCRGYYVDTAGKNAKKIEEYLVSR